VLSAKQVNHWYLFKIFGMTRSLTGCFGTWNLPHSNPSL